MNADMTMRRMVQAANRKEAERKQAEEQARQDAMNKRIEDVKQQSVLFRHVVSKLQVLRMLLRFLTTDAVHQSVEEFNLLL